MGQAVTKPAKPSRATGPLPAVDALLRDPAGQAMVAAHGHGEAVTALREVLAQARARLGEEGHVSPDTAALLADAVALAQGRAAPRLHRVFNLTGTVLHTNLGRALLSQAAIDHATMAMREACALEYDVETGGRGERDDLVEGLLVELTGAEAATVVNNNAAAVLIALAALAEGREVVLSRGELVEIGGAFRIPDVMRSAHARLVEVGTTNRTHARDYAGAIGPETAALMKVHPSNYRITGFTKTVSEAEVAAIAYAAGLPCIVDLGAGSLIDMAALGLPREPMVQDSIRAGADLVTFSGDKLLGGPQAGLIVGRRDLVERIRKHPLKRALRVSKMTLAALEATLLAYRRPETLARDLPTLRLLTRPMADMAAQAERLVPVLARALGTGWRVEAAEVSGQVGSGSLPGEELPGLAVALAPLSGSGGALDRLAARLRALPVPVIGRVAEGRLLLDLRCLEDEAGFIDQLSGQDLSA
jgi:L-seryl-tRNA(Ser) seleniumtransferase